MTTCRDPVHGDVVFRLDVLRRAVLWALVMWCLRPDAASPQWRQASRVTEWAQSEQGRASLLSPQSAAPTDLTNSVIIAAIGSAGGVLIGGLVGYSIDRARDVPSEDPGLMGLIYGALAGSAVLSPTLLYVANGSQGPWSRAVLLSAAGTTIVAAAFWPTDAVLFVPVIQIGVSVALLH